jgi:hypothetical protein
MTSWSALSVACECCGSAIGNDGNNRYIISGWRESDVTFHKALDAVEEKIQLMRVGNNYPEIRR